MLTIAPFTAAQNGDYTVRISAGARTQTSHPMPLAEVAEPVITAQPLGGDALLGQPYTFSVGFRAATGTVFQWRKNGVAITGATQQFLNLPALAFTDAGRRSVMVVLGLMVAFVTAGVIEGFVTPSSLPTAARVGIGLAVEVAFVSYVVGFGRRAAANAARSSR